jgi:4-amino-4-deoxychorismate lyase
MARTSLVMVNQPSAGSPPHVVGGAPVTRADPAQPQLSVLDLAATRGDGVFESISIADGQPHALDAHLARFARSAAILDLPAPDAATWRTAVDAVLTELDPVPEAFVKIVLSRGIEGDGRPTGWAYAAPAPDYSAARAGGIRIVLLDRGYRHDVERTSPWLLAGAKTLSYAINRAVVREAARRDADDVIFVSSDGYVLEGPNASVVFRTGTRLGTPGTGLGILDGTTQGDIFGWAGQHGFETGFELITAQQLRTTDAAWLVSSGRHALPIRAIDGNPHPVDTTLTAAFNAFLLNRRR